MLRAALFLAVGFALWFLLAAFLIPGLAFAHPVTVDGVASEWSPRTSVTKDTGIVAKDAGELIWTDAVGDARPPALLVTETYADMTAFQVTATATHLYFLVRGLKHHAANPPQVQIAIDVDENPLSGGFQFRGNAETSVGTGYERIVQTLFWTGTNTPNAGFEGAQVFHPNGLFASYAEATLGPDGAEIGVYWPALGLLGPPSTPINLTVAIFREGSNHFPVDITGSDARDALTDYGDPYVGPSPGTWAEVSDGMVHDFLSVWFEPGDGAVKSPLRISRVGRGADFWFVTVRNASPGSLYRPAFKVGDASIPEDPEGMHPLGAGSMPKYGRVTIASNAANFLAGMGHLPDLEVYDQLPDVPNTTKHTPWSSSSINMNWWGDEIVVLDVTNTIIDEIVWGFSSISGVVSCNDAFDSGMQLDPGEVYTENGYGDDCNQFMPVYPLCSTEGPCPSCRACVYDACVPYVGAPCSTAEVCGGICDADAYCTGGAPNACEDGNPCTQDGCDGAQCSHLPLWPMACPDADPCDGTEVCDVAGSCSLSTPPLDCDDTNPCTADVCEPGVGCTYVAVAMGVSCADSDACNGTEACDGESGCVAGAPMNCDDGNDCTADRCSGATGCVSENAGAEGACDDGDGCTGNDVCDGAGQCQGDPLTCFVPAPFCKDADTSASTSSLGCMDGMCQYDQVSTACDMGCDDTTGLCNGDPCAGVTCENPPTCYASPGKCSDGKCEYVDLALPETRCDDSDPCTDVDRCDDVGVCAGTPIACAEPPPPRCTGPNTSLQYGDAGMCIGGTCEYPIVGADCAFGCDGFTGLCQADRCEGVVCDRPPTECDQGAGTCTDGLCEYGRLDPGATCDDSSACTIEDACDAIGSCTGRPVECNSPPPPTCIDASASQSYDAAGRCVEPGGDCAYATTITDCALGCDAQTGLCDGDTCEGVTCDAPPGQCFLEFGDCADGACSYKPRDGGVPCDDGDACTSDDACDGEGGCGGTPVECNSPAPPVCEGDVSNVTSAVGTCNGGGCFYTGTATLCPFGCDPQTGLCEGDKCEGVTCDSSPGECYLDVGDCVQGDCSYTPHATDTPCEDGDLCTTPDTCDGAGECAGLVVECNAPPSPTCWDLATSRSWPAVGTCDPFTGNCEYAPVDSDCAFGCNAQTGLCDGDPCAGVTCDAPPGQCHLDLGDCTDGACSYTPRVSGAPCDDGDACTTDDACDGAGTCASTPLECNSPPPPACEGNVSGVPSAVGMCSGGECVYDSVETNCQFSCDPQTGFCGGDPCAGVTCDSPPGQCYLDIGDCTGGVCEYTPRPTDAPCDDGDPCTTTDACDSAGACAGSPVECNAPPPPVCSAADVSRTRAAAGVCDSAKGSCDYEATDTACPLGCNGGTGLCNGDPCAGVTCDSPPGACFLDIGDCAGGNCSYAARAMGIACDDGDACTVGDACDGEGACVGVADPGCGAVDGGTPDAGADASTDAPTDAGVDAGLEADEDVAVATADAGDTTRIDGQRDAGADAARAADGSRGVPSPVADRDAGEGAAASFDDRDAGTERGDSPAPGGCGCRLANTPQAPRTTWLGFALWVLALRVRRRCAPNR